MSVTGSFSTRNAVVSFLIVIAIYVLCTIGVQINWSNNAAVIFEPSCDPEDDLCEGVGSQIQEVDHDLGQPSWYTDMTRHLLNILGYSDNTTSTTLHHNIGTTKAFDKKDCFLTNKLDKPGMPIVHSIFADSISQEVIMTGVLRGFFDSWHKETFRCEFEVDTYTQIVTYTDPIVQDFKRFGEEPQYSVVITCPLPKELSQVEQFRMNLTPASNTTVSYKNIIVCQGVPIKDTRKHVLTMCTMTKNMDRYVPNWLNYHKFLGVEHVIIYDNSPKSTLPKTARRYIDNGFLTIIPWAHHHSANKTYLEVQVASENDCMWRYKHKTQWMIKIDVDEFLQPMDPNRTKITDYLTDDKLNFRTLGSVRIQNWFFCRHKQVNYAALKPLHSQRSVFERNLVRNAKPSAINRGRDKAIARPGNIHYYKIHGVKLGGDTISLSPTTEMRLVHYRGDNPRHAGFCSGKNVADFSMIRLWHRLHGADMRELEVHLGKMLELIRGKGKKEKEINKKSL
ncbi:beta-1,4-galactosyltransferase galt-1-like [Amphiura filiformis]|uniref:beta-1,4-galactosyltransferase galt-1-like n=1 Tax=Amphiura filiformis TaxID=82378 RepID=UPI003B2267F9